MKSITLMQPQKIVFGTGCMQQFCKDYLAMRHRRLFILTAPVLRAMVEESIRPLEGIEIEIYDDINAEPSLTDFYKVLQRAQAFDADSVVGIGGGSVLDLAKLVATLLHSEQRAEDLFGKGLVNGRGVWFACVPTTAGTGSEVSPNAILLDERDNQKKGIVSEHLMADVAYIDPQLTWTVPAKVTAETGMDALTHCIEAFTNKFAHPLVDMYARMGISLIASHLLRAVKDGKDVEAREAMALGSMYGGLCLGPVNTAAVHALSYPIGGEFHKSHGLSNAILLPTVMRFNTPSNVKKYAEVALACGCKAGMTDEETAEHGVRFIEQLSKDCGIPQTLSEIGIPQTAVDGMAKAAMDCQRLLQNNPREVTEQDCRNIYNSLY
ncbi:MAG: iron-containing alcohol dehydrogenase [Prevotella sp.]|nr:iron-containing alcohol dehydrogenase [Candidatus Equicola faecalis]